MKKIFKYLFLITLFTANQIISFIDLDKQLDKQEDKKLDRWSSYSYTGYAWSRPAGIVNPDPTIFTNTAKDDNDNGGLSNSPFAGVSLQRNFSNWCSLGFSYEIYALLNYQRYHVHGVPKLERLGRKYVRQFLLNHQSVMLEGYLKLPPELHLLLDRLNVTPLFGAAVGVGINDVYNFGAIGTNENNLSINYCTVGSNYIAKSLAYRFELGLRFSSLDSNRAFGVSYRYYYGGKFQTGPVYQFNSDLLANSRVHLPPWTGTLKANELKLYIEVSFN